VYAESFPRGKQLSDQCARDCCCGSEIKHEMQPDKLNTIAIVS